MIGRLRSAAEAAASRNRLGEAFWPAPSGRLIVSYELRLPSSALIEKQSLVHSLVSSFRGTFLCVWRARENCFPISGRSDEAATTRMNADQAARSPPACPGWVVIGGRCRRPCFSWPSPSEPSGLANTNAITRLQRALAPGAATCEPASPSAINSEFVLVFGAAAKLH